MLLTYLNLTPNDSVDINAPGADAEGKVITYAVNQAIKKKTVSLPKNERRKSVSPDYDEISLLDIFGALNY
jgi:hypothetical protein